LFADDTLIFCGAEEGQAEAIRILLQQYEEVSEFGQSTGVVQ